MVIYQPCSLHEGIAYCGSNKLETPLFEFLTYPFGLLCLRWHFRKIFEIILYCFSIYKLPDEFIEGAKLFLHFQKFGRVAYGCEDFCPIAYNAWISKQLINLHF